MCVCVFVCVCLCVFLCMCLCVCVLFACICGFVRVCSVSCMYACLCKDMHIASHSLSQSHCSPHGKIAEQKAQSHHSATLHHRGHCQWHWARRTPQEPLGGFFYLACALTKNPEETKTPLEEFVPGAGICSHHSSGSFGQGTCKIEKTPRGGFPAINVPRGCNSSIKYIFMPTNLNLN